MANEKNGSCRYCIADELCNVRQHLVKWSPVASWKTDPMSVESLALKEAVGKSLDIGMLAKLYCFPQVITKKK